MTRPLSISMTPVYVDPTHALLSAQLRCLADQTCQDFDVWLIDPHYSHRPTGPEWADYVVRKDAVPELAAKYGLDVKHVPYRANPFIAKKFDCAAFNAAYLYSQSPRCVRYSCWRFARPKWVETMMSIPDGVNVDMDYSDLMPTDASKHPTSGHDTRLWDYGTDQIRWDLIPAQWPVPSPIGPVLSNCYGNIMWWRDQWLGVNGTDEVFTNEEHYEDLEFDIRTLNAGHRMTRIPNLLFRLNHWHGAFGAYSNIPTEFPFKARCPACIQACVHGVSPNRFDVDRRAAAGEIELFPDECIWVCKTCLQSAPIWRDCCSEFLDHVRNTKRTKARVIAKYKIGRNLSALASDMDRETTLAGKVDVFNRSYYDERYYGAV